MLKIVLVLLYIWNGDIKLEQIPMKSLEHCEEAGVRYIEKLNEDPRLNQGLYAKCMLLTSIETNSF